MNKTLGAAFFAATVFHAVTQSTFAQPKSFHPGHLAVLRAGDGTADLATHQTPVFIDEYDAGAADQASPSFTVALPTTGTNALWINGNAPTEGGMARSADGSVLTVSGYCGNLLSKKGTPSKLAYDRGICVIAADASTRLAYSGSNWYGLSGGKTNPRGAVTDGTNNFWGCGSELGTLYYNAAGTTVVIPSVASTRAIRIFNGTLFFSIMGSDGLAGSTTGPAGGIYDFVDASGAPVPLPNNNSVHISLAVPTPEPYNHVSGFVVNAPGNLAYTADEFSGIQKYVKTGNDWKLACSFYIPGYEGPHTGILTNAASTQIHAGCFGLAADFSGAHPVVFATTTESIGYGTANVNQNRLIRIDDTNNVTTGAVVTNFGVTLARAAGTNISFRAIDFAPEARR